MKAKCKICGVEREKRNLVGDSKLCFKCFNEVEDVYKHSNPDWKEAVKHVRACKKYEDDR